MYEQYQIYTNPIDLYSKVVKTGISKILNCFCRHIACSDIAYYIITMKL